MIRWKTLTTLPQLAEVTRRSEEIPCLIFKHSTRCSLSSVAKLRLEEDWYSTDEEVEPFFLDTLQHREIARQIADAFFVPHESPQLLLIRNGECTYDASHMDISLTELRECFEDTW